MRGKFSSAARLMRPFKTILCILCSLTFSWPFLPAISGTSTARGAAPWRADVTKAIPVDHRLQSLITEIARGVIPHDYANEKDWGKTKKVVRGLYIKRDGLRIKTHRTMKDVNHGTWTKYRITLIDPHEQFQIRLENVCMLPDGRVAFDIICNARLLGFGRLSQWQQGVQIISLSAEANLDVELSMHCDLATKLDVSQLPPSLTLDPVVRDAGLEIKDFRLRRISQLHGPLVKSLSASIREVAEDEFASRREKLVAKINRHIDKKRDRFRLSFQSLLEESSDKDKTPNPAPQSSDK